MAKIRDDGVLIVVGTQVAEGTINTDVRDATAVGTTEGGGTALGLFVRRETLTLDLARLEEEVQDVIGTRTPQAADLIEVQASAFSFDVLAKGAGTTDHDQADEYDLPDAVEVLLQGAGLLKGAATTTLTPYALGEPVFLTIKVWRDDQSFTFQDCRVSSIAWAVTPKGVVPATVTIQPGIITYNNADTFPTVVDFGLQESTPSPILKGAGAAIGAVTRGFLSGTLTLENTFTPFADGNLPRGEAYEFVRRRVLWAGQFYVDSTDIDQDWTNLSLAADPTDDLVFVLGVANPGASGLANALRFTLRNVNWTAVNHAAEDSKRIVFDLAGYGTSDGAGDDEFLLESV